MMTSSWKLLAKTTLGTPDVTIIATVQLNFLLLTLLRTFSSPLFSLPDVNLRSPKLPIL